MTIHSIYRIGVWLPLILPAAVAGLVHGLGVRTDTWPVVKIVQVLLISLLYGGLPYAAAAIWATWWIGDRPEQEIRRMMARAPLLFAAAFVPVSVVTGLAVGAPGPFLAVAVLGAIVIVLLGYAYVALVMLLRHVVGARAV